MKSGIAPAPPEPTGDVEPLIHRYVDDDEAEFVDDVVGTSNTIADHRARNADGVVEQPSVNSTPPTEVATPPGELAAPEAEALG